MKMVDDQLTAPAE
jgi:hypothetical protein